VHGGRLSVGSIDQLEYLTGVGGSRRIIIRHLQSTNLAWGFDFQAARYRALEGCRVILTGTTVQERVIIELPVRCCAWYESPSKAGKATRQESKIGDPLPRDTIRSLYQGLPV
jgi:hypothetical protein